MGTLFLEHRFEFFKEQLDVTPGVAATYFSDFDIHFFPGIDVGYSLSNQWKLYANAGYTYRIPTYTDLYYSDPTTLGNEDLDPEEALAQEIGLRYNTPHISVTLAGFNRDSENLIDYVKENEEDIWRATNIRSLNTKGLEAQFEYRFEAVGFPQLLRLGYNFIEDEVKELDINFSRYSINSLKHQFVGTLQSQILKNVSQTIVYRYAERTAGESYSVVDIALSWNLKEFELSLIANNIFNEDYSETNLVPMPKGNVLFGVNYRLK
jgi:vitamin B12 transporter